MTKRVLLAVASSLALALAGCGGDDDDDNTNANGNGNANGNTNDNNDNGNGNGGCTGTIAVTYTVDTTANGLYDGAAGLAWKGSFDITGNTLSLDTAWGAPYPLIFDDATNGDETADDGIFTRTVDVEIGETETSFEYGLIRGSTAEADGTSGSDGDWIYPLPSNGQFTVPACATSDIVLPTVVLPAVGTTDLRITIDSNALNADFQANSDTAFQAGDVMGLKGPAMAGWNTELPFRDDGMMGDETAADGVFTSVTSNVIGPYDGLFKENDQPPFVALRMRDDAGSFVSVEYKGTDGALTDGISAAVQFDGSTDWVSVTIEKQTEGDKNTFVTIPGAP